MKLNKFGAAVALLALTAATSILPIAANADTQSNKNNWRNLGIGSAVVGGYGLLHHNTTLGVLGVAGAAYSANRYEHDRHNQSVAQSRRDYYRNHSYYHRYGYHHNYNNRYGYGH